jgi:hypothetical protein
MTIHLISAIRKRMVIRKVALYANTKGSRLCALSLVLSTGIVIRP